MEETRIVIDMTLLLLISGVCSIVFIKIKMPPILGYLTAGIILGPTMFPDLWVEGTTVELLSEIGIVFLLFFIGLETDIAKLKTTGMKLIFVVGIQMPIVVACGYLLGILLGMDFTQSIFLGAIISGTSTAVVVGVLRSNNHISEDLAKTIVTITIFEDVGQVIILTLAAPLLAGDAPALGSTMLMVVAMIIFIGVTLLLGLALVPKALNYIGDRFSGEILLIVSCGLCFATATVSMEIGLSIAIGAFIMGMIMSLSRYSHSIAGKVEPVKDLFMAVFFISIGLQISPSLIIDNIGLALIIAAVFIFSKIGSVSLGCYIANMKARESLVIGMSLVAMGEFAFIIAKQALDAEILSMSIYSAVIGAALITMVVMPILTKEQPAILDYAWRTVPKTVRGSIARIDEARSKGSRPRAQDSASRKAVKKGLALIAADCMIMLAIMVVFSLVGSVESDLVETADDLHLLPRELLLIALMFVLVPAIYSIRYNVKIIARKLTDMAIESSPCDQASARLLYRVYLDLGTIAMVLLVLVIIIPFVPEHTIISPLGAIIAVIIAMLITYLAWDVIKRGYQKFVGKFSKNDGCDPDERR